MANLPAPVPKSSISIGAPDYNRALRVAAIDAYISMPRGTTGRIWDTQQIDRAGPGCGGSSASLAQFAPRQLVKRRSRPNSTRARRLGRKVPESGRTSRDYVQTIQVADELAGILAPDKGAAIRHDLKSLRVPVFVVHTVREQMRFDTTRLVVEAGKPFQVIVENVDFMPHNFVIVKPNTREKVGARTETMRPDQIDSQGRAFMPRTSDILAGTRLLESGQSATLSLTAPDTGRPQRIRLHFPRALAGDVWTTRRDERCR